MGLLQMSFSSIALITMVVVIRILAMDKVPKRTFLVLWAIVVGRLLIPLSVPSRLSIYTLINRGKKITISPNMLNISSHRMATTTGIGISTVAIVWLIGMVICGLFIIGAHLKCRKEYKMALPIENDFITMWLGKNSLKRSIEIRQSDKIITPLTYGIWKPVILLPKTMDLSNTQQISLVLTHEFTHIRRFDVLSKWVLATALCIHWFNPFVWGMYILANRDIELSCDETVVQTFGETIKPSYALTLIGLEEKKIILSPLCNNFSKNSIEGRIRSIMKMKKMSIVSKVLAFILVVGTITIFATSELTQDMQTATTDSQVPKLAQLNQVELRENTYIVITDRAAKIKDKNAQIVEDIESGKIKPIDLSNLPDTATVFTVDADGNTTALKEVVVIFPAN